MAMRKRRRRTMLQTAGRGAVAGLLGGVALAAADRLVAPRLAGGGPRGRKWDRHVAAGADAMGVRVPRRHQPLAGIAVSLAYAAALGAVYAVARERLRGIAAAETALDAALAYGVSVVVPARSRPPRGPKGARLAGKVATRVDDPELFRHVTTLALRILP